MISPLGFGFSCNEKLLDLKTQFLKMPIHKLFISVPELMASSQFRWLYTYFEPLLIKCVIARCVLESAVIYAQVCGRTQREKKLHSNMEKYGASSLCWPPLCMRCRKNASFLTCGLWHLQSGGFSPSKYIQRIIHSEVWPFMLFALRHTQVGLGGTYSYRLRIIAFEWSVFVFLFWKHWTRAFNLLIMYIVRRYVYMK